MPVDGKETAMFETAMTAEKASAEKVCLRCGGDKLISAHLEHPIAFCVDHVTHHGRVHLSLRALLCQGCGHVEFWMPDPPQLVGAAETAKIQEEDF